MTTMTIEMPGEVEVGVRKVDVTKGSNSTLLQREWYARPDDERYLNLNDLAGAVGAHRNRSNERTVAWNKVRFVGDDASDFLGLEVDGQLMEPTHWSFSQLCSSVRLPSEQGTVGMPVPFLRAMPARIAALNLQVASHLQGGSTMLYHEKGDAVDRLRAVTSPSYGRIYDADVVGQVQKIADAGAWKVPGVLNWNDGTYNPHTPVTKATTTLFASDRDVSIYMVDDLHPIEVGKLKNGDPDLMFRGFMISNSEVGGGRFFLATMYLRAVCCNRMLWGVENLETATIRHNSGAPTRFLEEALPALENLSTGDPSLLVQGVRKAKELVIAKSERGQLAFLTNDLGFSQEVAKQIVGVGREQEGRDPVSAWDFSQAITAYAQSVPHASDRFEVEQAASKVLAKVN